MKTGDRATRWAILWVMGVAAWAAQATVAHAAEVTIQASVDRSEVPLNQQVALVLSVEAPDSVPAGQIDLGDTGSLRVTGTRTEDSLSFSFRGGKRQFTKIQKFVYILSPTKTGTTRIGPAKLKYQGKIYSTKAIRIQVVAASKKSSRTRRSSPFGSRSPFPNNFDDFFRSSQDLLNQKEELKEDDIFVRATVSQSAAVVGQQVTVTLRVYSRVGARLASSRWPKLDGFFIVPRDTSRSQADQKYVDGKLYRFLVLAQKALFPIQSGELTIAPIEVEMEISSSPFLPVVSKTLYTKPLTVSVRDLPAAGRPEDFRSGNVGQFSLSGGVDSTEVALNQPVTYTLRLQGTGNIQGVRPPKLPELARFKIFDPTVDVQVGKRGRTVKGTKSFEYILVPLASGTLEIPSLSFSFFDPRQSAYRTLKTKVQQIRVAASKENGKIAAVGAGHEVNILAGAFKPIRFQSALTTYGEPVYRHSWFLPLLLSPPGLYLLVALFAFVRARGRTNSVRNRMRRAWLRRQRRLKQAGRIASTGKAAEFYAELSAALMDAVEARTGIAPAGMTLVEVTGQMEQLGVSSAVAEQIKAEAENCDFGRFAPASSRGDQMQDSLERVRKVIKSLERERVRPQAETT